MVDGFILVWRKLMDKGYYKKSHYIHLWLHLLFKANFKKTNFIWNGKEVILERGQFLTGRKKLSEETGIRPGTIENILKMFENEHQIKQQKTNLFRIITIINYDKMQKLNNNNDNEMTTNEQQNDNEMTHINKEKNDNKEKKEEKETILEKSLLSLFNEIKDSFSPEELTNKDAFLKCWTEKNKNGRKERWQMQKTFDVSRRFRTWLRNKEKWNTDKKDIVIDNDQAFNEAMEAIDNEM